MKKKQESMLLEFAGSGQKFEMETIDTRDGNLITIYFFAHASVAFVFNGLVVYVDPLGEHADHSHLPKADLILITHEHYDHLDPDAVELLRKPETVVVGSRGVGERLPEARVFPHGHEWQVAPGVRVEAVPAYNTSPEQLQFHPRERGDNGYILSLGATRIYIAGDTEPTPEMAKLGEIDVMFLPVNQPYTMTPAQAALAAKTIAAPLFFPYHTTDTDMSLLAAEMSGTPGISVRIHNMP